MFCSSRLAPQDGSEDLVHWTRQSLGKRLHRILQRKTERWIAQRWNLRYVMGSQSADRTLEERLQLHQTAQFTGLQSSGTGSEAVLLASHRLILRTCPKSSRFYNQANMRSRIGIGRSHSIPFSVLGPSLPYSPLRLKLQVSITVFQCSILSREVTSVSTYSYFDGLRIDFAIRL